MLQKVKKIGSGTFGAVWLVESSEDGAQYALKSINHDHSLKDKDNSNGVKTTNSKESNKEVPDEINIIQQLQDCKYILKLHNHYTDPESHHLCLVLDYCEGGDLQAQIKAKKLKNEKFSSDQILTWFVQICLGVQVMHSRNILHRDLKPSNILLTTSNPQNQEIRIGDFGVSKALDTSQNMASTSLGTPYYLPPEICVGQPYDSKADMWMLGCILYELVTLNRPFPGQNLNQVVTLIVNESYAEVEPGLFSQVIDMLLDKRAFFRASIEDIMALPEIQTKVRQLSKVETRRQAQDNLTRQFMDELIGGSKKKNNQAVSQQETLIKTKNMKIQRQHQMSVIENRQPMLSDDIETEDLQSSDSKKNNTGVQKNSILYLIQQAKLKTPDAGKFKAFPSAEVSKSVSKLPFDPNISASKQPLDPGSIQKMKEDEDVFLKLDSASKKLLRHRTSEQNTARPTVKSQLCILKDDKVVKTKKQINLPIPPAQKSKPITFRGEESKAVDKPPTTGSISKVIYPAPIDRKLSFDLMPGGMNQAIKPSTAASAYSNFNSVSKSHHCGRPKTSMELNQAEHPYLPQSSDAMSSSQSCSTNNNKHNLSLQQLITDIRSPILPKDRIIRPQTKKAQPSSLRISSDTLFLKKTESDGPREAQNAKIKTSLTDMKDQQNHNQNRNQQHIQTTSSQGLSTNNNSQSNTRVQLMTDFLKKKLGKDQFRLILESNDPEAMLANEPKLKDKQKRELSEAIQFIKNNQNVQTPNIIF